MATTINNKSLSSTSIAVFLFMIICSSILASSIPRQPSVNLLVEKKLTIDLGSSPEEWFVETQPNRILFFSFIDDEAERSQEWLESSLIVYDAKEPFKHSLFPKKSENGLVVRKFYSKGNAVVIRLNPTSVRTSLGKITLQIEKAVECPFNWGGISSCGRIYGDLSCYCGIYQPTRNWGDMRTECRSHPGFQFVALESAEEDRAVYNAFGGTQAMWLGASDVSQENYWIWDATGKPMSPGYSNWQPGQPDNWGGREDYLHYWPAYGFHWTDGKGGERYGGICEAQP